jgi:folate-binding protein YgfZ
VSEAAVRAALTTCAFADRSDLARLRAEGPDFLELLQRLSTGDVRGLSGGEGRATVVTTPKGRIVDRLFVHALRPDAVLAVGSSGRGAALLAHFTRYTFAERTGLAEVTQDTVQLALLGPRAQEAAAGAGLPVTAPLGIQEGEWTGAAVTVVGEDGTSAEGLSLVAHRRDAPRIAEALRRLVPELDAAGLEAWRILRGLPGAAEMDAERNPLEAGLWDAVSFTKGCYVGQEVVARLKTYDKVVRTLGTVALPAGSGVPPPGTALQQGDRAVGTITSAVLPPGSSAPIAMGYLRREAAVAGAQVTAVWGNTRAEGTVLLVPAVRAA